MIVVRLHSFLLLAPAACLLLVACTSATDGASPPVVYCWDAQHLFELRHHDEAERRAYQPALDQLRTRADAALEAGEFSVMSKKATPPSGDKHDYMSQGPYWWPSPDSEDGLPYVKRDGQINPEYKLISDPHDLNHMSDAVVTLALADYLLDQPRYGKRAAELVRVWFLNPQTRMNPHLRYGRCA